MLKRRPPKFPLKMENGTTIRSIEELRNNADADSLLNYFFQGTLVNWSKAYHYDDEAERLFELNNRIVRNICEILSIEYSDEMTITNPHKAIYYDDNVHSIHISNQLDKDFLEYSKDKINLQHYELEFMPFDYGSNLFGNVEVRIHNILTELTLNCLVPYDNSEQDEDELNNDFFNRVISIIKEMEKINNSCSLQTSESGGYGYGLELI